MSSEDRERPNVYEKFVGDKVGPDGQVIYSREDHARKMEARNMTPDGAEIPDPRPAKPSVRIEHRKSMFDYMREAMAVELARREADAEQEDPEAFADMGDDEEDAIERLSEYERHDLEVSYAQAEKALERQQKAAKGRTVAPKAPAAEGSQGAEPAEGGAPGAPLTAEGDGAKEGSQ